MKNNIAIILLLALVTGFSLQSAFGQAPLDPAGKGNGILGFSFGPGIPYYGGSGFGPAILVHYDHSIWRAGPGSISLGGQIGTSFFSHPYYHQNYQYRERWTNIGIIFRAAYHYGWKVPGLDTYAGLGAGPVFSMYKFDTYDYGKNPSCVGFTPTAFVGASYFFSRVVGVNAEMGYNFAFISLGLNFRIVR